LGAKGVQRRQLARWRDFEDGAWLKALFFRNLLYYESPCDSEFGLWPRIKISPAACGCARE